MRYINDYIKKDDLIIGRKYRVYARNFSEATWTGYAFIGRRRKFNMEFDDEEYHWDDGAPHGTVKPIELIEDK